MKDGETVESPVDMDELPTGCGPIPGVAPITGAAGACRAVNINVPNQFPFLQHIPFVNAGQSPILPLVGALFIEAEYLPDVLSGANSTL